MRFKQWLTGNCEAVQLHKMSVCDVEVWDSVTAKTLFLLAQNNKHIAQNIIACQTFKYGINIYIVHVHT